MTITYINAISEGFPGVAVSAQGDGSIYSSLIYDAANSTAPMPTQAELDVWLLTNAISSRCEDVNSLRSTKLYGGYTDTNSVLWDSTPIDIANLNAVVTLVTAGAITGNVVWRSTNNTQYNMTPTQLVQLAGGLAVFGQTLYTVSWEHKANIAALTSVSSINSYDINTGW